MSSWGRVAFTAPALPQRMTTSVAVQRRQGPGRVVTGDYLPIPGMLEAARIKPVRQRQPPGFRRPAAEGAKLLAVATAAAACQRRVEPGECRHPELFGQAIDGGQRDLFVAVRESAFSMDKLQQRGEAQSPPAVCAARKAASRRRSGPGTERVHHRSSVVSFRLGLRKGVRNRVG